MSVREIELFKEGDWSENDKNVFLRRRFNLLTYQQISETKIGDLEKSDKTQNLISGLIEEENFDKKIGNLKSFYAIGEVQTQEIAASKVALYNKTLLSMVKNKYASNLLKRCKKINNLGRERLTTDPRAVVAMDQYFKDFREDSKQLYNEYLSFEKKAPRHLHQFLFYTNKRWK